MLNDSKEISNSKYIYQFLCELVKESQGQLLLDFYSYSFYDEIIKIEKLHNGILKLYWKNIDVKQHDTEIIKSDYIYSLVRINKILITDKGRIYIKANLLKRSKIKKILNLNDKIDISSDSNNLFSEIEFLDKQGSYHACIISDMPFYSMRISTKGNSFSKYELYYLNVSELINRFDKIDLKIGQIDKFDSDEIGEKGNSLRKILERVLKLYIIVKEYYSFGGNSKSNYDSLTLGSLHSLLHNREDNICKLLNKKALIIANKFSHDSGENPEMSDLIWLRNYTEKIIAYVIRTVAIN